MITSYMGLCWPLVSLFLTLYSSVLSFPISALSISTLPIFSASLPFWPCRSVLSFLIFWLYERFTNGCICLSGTILVQPCSLQDFLYAISHQIVSITSHTMSYNTLCSVLLVYHQCFRCMYCYSMFSMSGLLSLKHSKVYYWFYSDLTFSLPFFSFFLSIFMGLK